MRQVRFDVDGEPVAGTLHEPPSEPRGQVVLAHGLLSQAAEFADFPEKLAARGYRVLAYDQRGFGASGGPPGLITLERATADARAAIAFLRQDAPDLPTGVVGHSMGAVFALGALAQDPSLKAGVLAAPMRTVRAEIGDAEFLGYRAGRAISVVKERLGFGPLVVPYKNQYSRLFHDRKAARRAEEAGFLSTSVSLANYDALLAMDSEKLARGVRQPVLVVVGQYDKAVKTASSRAVHDALAGPKEWVVHPCGHSLWGDCSAGEVLDDVDAWLSKHLR